MASNLPPTQKENWAPTEVVKPEHTNSWGSAINKLTTTMPLYASNGNYYEVQSFSDNIINLSPIIYDDGTQNQVIQSYVDGMHVNFKSTFTNTEQCSVNINNLGTKQIKTLKNENLIADSISSGYFIELIYNKENDVFYLLESKPANSDLSNLTTTGEKHFLNKSQITNCILEAPNGVATYSGNVVTVPTGVKALVNSGVTNADGTIKNVEVTTLEAQTINVSTTGIIYLGSDGTLNTTSGAPLVSVVYGTSSISAIYPYSPVELLKKSDIEEITKTSRNPIGQPQITLSNTLEDNEIWLEGATVSRTTYAELFKIYGTTYGTGDGSTTFVLPNFKNRAIWGYNEFGYINAGLPNITGTFRGINYGDASGAFTLESSNYGYASFNSRNGDVTKWTFNASRSSSIYGESSTVQPPAIKVRVKTRYK